MGRLRDDVSIAQYNTEQELIALAQKKAKELLTSDNPPPSLVLYYCRKGDTKEDLEIERLATNNELNRKKAEAIEAATDSRNVAEAAIEAMARYRR